MQQVEGNPCLGLCRRVQLDGNGDHAEGDGQRSQRAGSHGGTFLYGSQDRLSYDRIVPKCQAFFKEGRGGAIRIEGNATLPFRIIDFPTDRHISMALERYRQKRDFRITPEPAGKVKKRKSRELAFVVQKHAATRLHYDFRLELDGVLLSWAVPKGPSLDPNDKRLAMHVEDHPLEYGEFEGVIPPKQYGAGTVMVWDRGRWTPKSDPKEGYAKGRRKCELN